MSSLNIPQAPEPTRESSWITPSPELCKIANFTGPNGENLCEMLSAKQQNKVATIVGNTSDQSDLQPPSSGHGLELWAWAVWLAIVAVLARKKLLQKRRKQTSRFTTDYSSNASPINKATAWQYNPSWVIKAIDDLIIGKESEKESKEKLDFWLVQWQEFLYDNPKVLEEILVWMNISIDKIDLNHKVINRCKSILAKLHLPTGNADSMPGWGIWLELDKIFGIFETVKDTPTK